MKKLLIGLLLLAATSAQAQSDSIIYKACSCISNGCSNSAGGLWGFTLKAYRFKYMESDNLGDFFDVMSDDDRTRSSQLISLRRMCYEAKVEAIEKGVCP